jgi:hypothetical protein
MVSAFVESSSNVDFEAQNVDSLTCTEAHQEDHGFDEAAQMVDNIHLHQGNRSLIITEPLPLAVKTTSDMEQHI